MGDADTLSRLHFPRGLELGLAGGVLLRFSEVEIETKGKLHEPRPDFAIRLGAKLGDVRLLEIMMPELGILLAQVAASADHEDATLELTAGPRQLKRIAEAAQAVGAAPEPQQLAASADWMTAVFDLPAYDPGYLSVIPAVA
ncbi:MAG: hypothetical protein V4510_09175 [bacterium]